MVAPKQALNTYQSTSLQRRSKERVLREVAAMQRAHGERRQLAESKKNLPTASAKRGELEKL